MELKELKQWLRDNSSGVYRPAKEAADVIERMETALRWLAECELSEHNCASFEVANQRIRSLAMHGLGLGDPKPK